MIVYVESNFVLEMALEQEQFSAASEILQLAEQKEITLSFPSFVLSEPFECVMRERRERNTLHSSLLRTLGKLRRSEPHKEILLNMEPVVNVLRDAHTRQLALLQATFGRLIRIGKCIELHASAFDPSLIKMNMALLHRIALSIQQ